jgi:hypothetical protein
LGRNKFALTHGFHFLFPNGRRKLRPQESKMNDRLTRVREMAKQARDLGLSIKEKEDELNRTKSVLRHLQESELVDLFMEANIDHLGLPAEGNLPAYDLNLKPYCAANIAAGWPEEKRATAFQWLTDNDAGDLIKSVITIELDRGELRTMKKVQAALRKLDVDFEVKMSVPHGTLTAYVKELLAENQSPPLDVLGARIGQEVKMKPRED